MSCWRAVRTAAKSCRGHRTEFFYLMLSFLFWMILSFGIVLIILSKYGFPVIVKAIEDRKAFIEESLNTARQANEQLANIKEEGERIISEAKEKQNAILKEALKEKEHIIEEAHQKAAAETHRQMEEATRQIREEKEKAIREVRKEITDLSIAIAEKVMKEKINRDNSQEEIINKLLDEMSFNKS